MFEHFISLVSNVVGSVRQAALFIHAIPSYAWCSIFSAFRLFALHYVLLLVHKNQMNATNQKCQHSSHPLSQTLGVQQAVAIYALSSVIFGALFLALSDYSY